MSTSPEIRAATRVASWPIGVKIARAVGVPHDTLGEIVVTCIVPKDDVTLDEAAVQAFLKERLARYKVPRHVLFLREDAAGRARAQQLIALPHCGRKACLPAFEITGLDGTVWNILGQTYSPKLYSTNAFVWHALLPVDAT